MLRTKATGFPKSILIETSTDCNGECVFCPYSLYRRGKGKKNLSEEKYIELIKELSIYGVQRITLFCSNEPLLDKRIVKFVSLARKYNLNAEITLSTNGRLLTSIIVNDLYESGLSVLYVSIPTLNPKAYEALMKYPLSYVLKSLEDIYKTRARSIIKLAVPETYAFDEKEFIDYCSKNSITFSAWPIEYKTAWNLFDYNTMSYRKGEPKDPRPCDRPLDQACILADGNIVLCCRDWDNECVVGNINKNTIAEIWKSEKMIDLQHKIINGEYNLIPLCKDCSENPNNNN